jgi:hemerythrin-like domain-containing protein
MKPTEILSAEHRVIERVLDSLDRISDEAQAAGRLNEGDARDVLDFLRNFADRCHHGKEEHNLFPAMEAQGFPASGGPIAVMLAEHEAGRAHLRAMDESLALAAAGDTQALGRFVEHARAYCALLRQHIHKEDNILFVLADRVLGPDEQTELLQRFEHVEAEHMGVGTHEKYLALADRLTVRYGLPPEPAATCIHCCGHD